MKVKRVKKALALLIVMALSLSCASVPYQALANGEGKTVYSESDSSGGAGEETGGGESGVGGEDDNNGEAGNDGEDNDNTGTGEEDNHNTGTDGEDDDNTGTDGEDDDNTRTDGEDDDNTGTDGEDDDKTGTDGEDDDSISGGEDDHDNEIEEIEDEEEDQDQDGLISADNPDAGSNASAQYGEYSIEALKGLLYEYAGYTGYDPELVDWIIDGFSHDESFMYQIYEAILELIAEGDSSEAEPNETALQFVDDFLKSMSEYRNPVYDGEGERGGEGDTGEIVRAVAEFSQIVADEKDTEKTFNASDRVAPVAGVALNGRAQVKSNEEEEKLTYFSEQEVSYLKKTITKDDTQSEGLFRHYNVELEFKANEVEVELSGQPADIVLIVDKSGSMQGDRIKAAKEAAASFVDGLTGSGGNLIGDVRIGVVAYANAGTGSSGTSNHQLSTNISNIKSFINDISTDGGTNTQYAILEAKRILGLKDGDTSVSTGRKKIIILLSDGEPTYRYTDVWTSSQNRYSISCNSSRTSAGYTSEKYKRWSFSTASSPGNTSNLRLAGSESVSYGSSWTSGGNGNAVDAVTEKITLLEAQYAVGQGIDMYTVDFSGGNTIKQLMSDMTYAMTNIPSGSGAFLGGSITNKYAPGIGVNTNNYSGKRAYSANNADDLRSIYAEIKSIVQGEMAAFTVTDELADNFELIPDPTLNATDGTALYDKTENTVTWSIPSLQPAGTDENGKYAVARLSYQVRVIDEEVWHTGAGLNGTGTPKQPPAKSTAISYVPVNAYSVTTLTLNEQPLMTVDPLINGRAFIEDSGGDPVEAVLEGEFIHLSGVITNGNTEFDYQWYTGTGPGKIPVQNANGKITEKVNGYGNGLDIPVTNANVKDLTPSEDSTYTLRLHDRKAETAGYKNPRVLGVELPLQVKVFKPVLMIQVIGEGIDGRFETKVNRTPAGYDAPDRQWYFIGLDKKEYTSADGIVRGTYLAEAYVPYGYDVNATEPVTITLTKNNDGEYTGYRQEITITVSGTDPWYFYNWDWPEDHGAVPVATSGSFPFMTAVISGVGAKKRRWFR